MNDLTAIFGAEFEPNSIEAQSDFDVIPPGKYPVLIEAAQVKPTKKQDGHYIELTLIVLDEKYKNRKVWDRINIDNPSQKCVEIGLRHLAALGQSLGLVTISDTSQLVNQTCIAHIKVKDDQNEVRTYSAMTSQPAQLAVAPSVRATTAPAIAPSTYPPQATPQSTAPQAVATGNQDHNRYSANKPPWAR